MRLLHLKIQMVGLSRWSSEIKTSHSRCSGRRFEPW